MPSIRKTKKRLKRELKKAIAEQEVIGELRADIMGGETKRAKLDEVKVYGSRDVSVS